jgi:alpha-aminoadipate carrier protein LysW
LEIIIVEIKKCVECDQELVIPDDAVVDDIITCSECGCDYVVFINDKGEKKLKELNLKGEDWGE